MRRSSIVRLTVAGLFIIGVTAICHGGTGDRDTTFAGGTKDFPIPGEAQSVALQPNGKIVITGQSDDGQVFIARYLSSGNLDLQFGGTGGKVMTSVGILSEGKAVTVQSDGKSVVVGQSDNTLLVLRYLATGQLDPAFSGDGVVTMGCGGKYILGAAVTIQADGKIVVAGTLCPDAATPSTCDFLVMRMLSNGELDPSFGQGGQVTTDIFYGDEAHAVKVQPDGKIVVAGLADLEVPFYFALARYLPNGELDTSFGFEGVSVSELVNYTDGPQALLLQPDGKMVAVGTLYDFVGGGGDFLAIRYTANGMQDEGFGFGGEAYVNFGGAELCTATVCPWPEVRAATLDLEGKVTMTGQVSDVNNGDAEFAVARLTTDGFEDLSFHGDGYVTSDLGGSEVARGIVQQFPHGRLIVAGTQDGNVALARYHAYVCNGKNATRVGTTGNDIINGTGGADVILGLEGDDIMNGMGGNDSLCGGAGNDTINGGSGNDVLKGGKDDDHLSGDAGTDKCNGDQHVVGDTATKSCEQKFSIP